MTFCSEFTLANVDHLNSHLTGRKSKLQRVFPTLLILALSSSAMKMMAFARVPQKSSAKLVIYLVLTLPTVS